MFSAAFSSWVSELLSLVSSSSLTRFRLSFFTLTVFPSFTHNCQEYLCCQETTLFPRHDMDKDERWQLQKTKVLVL
ncbi:hypothetical protein F5H01DRAFT_14886 [Linnemannia elongata]|nr:hypothetical protein F5H01DRAFT_14886 [Linnemannia elongata]